MLRRLHVGVHLIDMTGPHHACTLFGGGERFDVVLGVDDPRSLGGFMLQDDVRNQCGIEPFVRLVPDQRYFADEPSTRFVSTTL